MPLAVCVAVIMGIIASGCGSSGSGRSSVGPRAGIRLSTRSPARHQSRFRPPPLLDRHDVYAADRPGLLAPLARDFPQRVYVPNSESNTVDVIDQRSFKVIDQFPVGALPQHVTPSYDLKTLWVTNDEGNSLTPIDPATGKPGKPVSVTDPYNLYFTADGRYAIVVAERLQRLDFRRAHTMALRHSLHVPCDGVDHLDFSASGRFLVASCGFGGSLVKVDVAREKVVGSLALKPGAMPQDVKLSPDGRIFYVADMMSGGGLADRRRPLP